MSKKECPGCAVEVGGSNNVCPICGYEFPDQPRGIKIMAVLMAILLLLWIVL